MLEEARGMNETDIQVESEKSKFEEGYLNHFLLVLIHPEAVRVCSGKGLKNHTLATGAIETVVQVVWKAARGFKFEIVVTT